MRIRLVLTTTTGNVHYGKYQDLTEEEFANVKSVMEQKLNYLSFEREDGNMVIVYGSSIESLLFESGSLS